MRHSSDPNFLPAARAVRRLAQTAVVASLLAASIVGAWAEAETSQPTTRELPRIEMGFAGMAQYPTLDDDPEKPSDVHIAVGPGRGAAGRIVQVTNNGVQIFDKNGETVAGPVPLEQFVGAPPNTCFDPKVLYDQHSKRFFIVMPGTKEAATSRLHVAVSGTSVPANLKSNWTCLSDSSQATFGGTETWLDYPAMGADVESLVVTGNMSDENKAHRGVKIRVFDKGMLLRGVARYKDLDLAADDPAGGVYTLQPVHVYGRTVNGRFYLISRCGAEKYRLWEIESAPRFPRIVASEPRPWEGGQQIRLGAPQPGSSGVTLHPSSGKVMNAVFRAGSFWCVLTSDMDGDGATEVVWFRIRARQTGEDGSSVVGTGVIGGSEPGAWTFVPAIGVDAKGRALVCYTESSPLKFPEMRVAQFADVTTQTPTSSSLAVKGSVGVYDNMDRHNPEKWADYCACVSDPDEEGVFWVAHEVGVAARREGDDAQWGTWIARVRPAE